MYKYPSTNLLKVNHVISGKFNDREYIKALADELMTTLKAFKVDCKIIDCRYTPFAIMFDILLDQGVSVKSIKNLRIDLEVHTASPIEIVDKGEGTYTISLAIKNWDRPIVGLREVIESKEFVDKSKEMEIPIAVGVDVFGQSFCFDLAETPHLLVAGTTGSGKSVFLNDVLLSILFTKKPDEVQLILIDLKMVEFTPYQGIPHLLRPVIYDTKHSLEALDLASKEMDRRYAIFASLAVKNIESFNSKVSKDIKLEMSNPDYKSMPRIVIVVDEYMEMIFEAKKELEEYVTRISRLGRAAGIHLVFSTQRPTSDVVTAGIKTNIPCRASFTVIDWRESKAILDRTGAERLLGSGDMLFSMGEASAPVHAQAAFVDEEDIDAVISTVRKNTDDRIFNTGMLSVVDERIDQLTAYVPVEGRDPYLLEAAKYVIENNAVSIGAIQRRFKIGFNRAAYVLDQLTELGIVSEENVVKPRTVLVTDEELENMIISGIFDK